MKRDDAISRLKAREADIRSHGATSLFLFGSTARNAESSESDVDLFVDYDPERFGFVELVRLRESLSAALGVAADLTTREGLHPRLRSAIDAEAVRILWGEARSPGSAARYQGPRTGSVETEIIAVIASEAKQSIH
jgi:uncharacterized protein